jgi:hypothetical protein
LSASCLSFWSVFINACLVLVTSTTSSAYTQACFRHVVIFPFIKSLKMKKNQINKNIKMYNALQNACNFCNIPKFVLF